MAENKAATNKADQRAMLLAPSRSPRVNVPREKTAKQSRAKRKTRTIRIDSTGGEAAWIWARPESREDASRRGKKKTAKAEFVLLSK
jgi:hypothetical protein